MLYELLTGRLPYRLHGTQLGGGHRAQSICADGAAAARARVTDARRSARRLRGDLDNIVLMALRKEPERRYASVEQFSETSAAPGRAARCWRARTRWVTARQVRAAQHGCDVAAALVVLSLVGGIVMTTWQAQRWRRKRSQLPKRRGRSGASTRCASWRTRCCSTITTQSRTCPARPLRERLVKDGLAYLDSLASEASDDPGLQRELAAAYERVGDVRGKAYSAANLGDFAGATESYTKALQIREALVAADPDDLQSRRDLAASYQKSAAQLLETSEAERRDGIPAQGRRGIRAARRGSSGRPEVRQELAAPTTCSASRWRTPAIRLER